jgi:hypothetical protein
VDRSRLVSTRWSADIEGVDHLLLRSVFDTPLRTRARRACGRVAAALKLIVASPCLVASKRAAYLRSRSGVIRSLYLDVLSLVGQR